MFYYVQKSNRSLPEITQQKRRQKRRHLITSSCRLLNYTVQWPIPSFLLECIVTTFPLTETLTCFLRTCKITHLLPNTTELFKYWNSSLYSIVSVGFKSNESMCYFNFVPSTNPFSLFDYWVLMIHTWDIIQ